MANHKTKLELTWIDKGNRPKLETRVVVEERAKSRQVSFCLRKNEFLDDGLMSDDNLSGLKALDQNCTVRVKSVFIDLHSFQECLESLSR